MTFLPVDTQTDGRPLIVAATTPADIMDPGVRLYCGHDPAMAAAVAEWHHNRTGETVTITELIGGLLYAAPTTNRCGPQQIVVPAPRRQPRKPRRPIAPIPQPVHWGPPTTIERRPFDPDATRRRGCAAAAGVDTIGELT